MDPLRQTTTHPDGPSDTIARAASIGNAGREETRISVSLGGNIDLDAAFKKRRRR